MDKKYLSDSALDELFHEFSKGYIKSVIDTEVYPLINKSIEKDIVELEWKEDAESVNRVKALKETLKDNTDRVETIKESLGHWECMLDQVLLFKSL